MARSSATRSKGCTTLARIRYIVAEAYRGFRRNLLLAGSMVIIVAISLTLFGITLQQRESIGGQIRALPAVETVFYESQQQAYQRFKDQFRDSPDMVRNVTASVLPESYRVKLRDPNQFDQVHDLFCSGKTDSRGKEICNAGIDSVVDQRKLVERLFAILNMLKNSFFVLSAVLGMAAVVLIAVTVRVAAFARRKET